MSPYIVYDVAPVKENFKLLEEVVNTEPSYPSPQVPGSVNHRQVHSSELLY